MSAYKSISEFYSDDERRTASVIKEIGTNRYIVRLKNEAGSAFSASFADEESAEQYAEECKAAHEWVHSEESMMTAKAMSKNIIEGIDETFAKWTPRHRFELIQVEIPKQPKHYVKHSIAK